MPYIETFACVLVFLGVVIFYISRKIFKHSVAESALNIMAAAQVNTAYFALPIFILLFNNVVPVISILLLQVVVLTTIVLVLIEWDLSAELKLKELFLKIIPKVIFTNPLVVASLLGLLFSAAHFSVPTVLRNFLQLLGDTAAPLALFSLGFSLVGDLGRISGKELWEMILLILTKIIIAPALGFLLGYYVFHLSYFWLASLVLMAAMPAPKNMFIFAMRYNLDVKRAASVVAFTTLISFVTLNILLMIFHPALIK